jgi:ATP synthase protein I
VLNSIASGRRLALRLLLWQLVAAIVVGLAFSVRGFRWAIAGVTGAAIVAVGNALLSTRLFSQVSGAGMALARLLTGMILKWMVIVGGMIIVMFQYKLPPLAAITGLVAAYAINLLAFRFKG